MPGTDLGAAVETGLSAFDFKAETDKVMMLITDGEDNEQRGLPAARAAAGKGVRIFVFGMGDPSGGPVPAVDGQGGFTKDSGGHVVLSKLDEKTLQDLASVTGGGYVRSVAGDLDLDMLYFAGIKQKTEDQVLKSGKIKVYEERFNIFVLAAFLLLFFEGLLDDKRRPASGKRFGFLAGLAVCGLISLMVQTPVKAAESPDELYRQGRYADAENAYARADMDHPRDIRYRYNRGCAAFQGGRYPEAAAAFSSVMRRATDPGLRFRAAYNLGNAAFKQGDFAGAAAHYKQAIAAQPANADARHNLELALRALAQNEKQPPESPKSDPETGDSQADGEPGEQGEQGEQGEDPGQNGQPPRPEAPKDDPGKSDDPGGDRGKAPDDSGAAGPESSDSQQEQGGKSGTRPEAGADANRTGALKPIRPPAALKQGPAKAGDDPSATDKNRAEALLDNVQEDPAGMLRFMIPGEKRRAAASGRDW